MDWSQELGREFKDSRGYRSDSMELKNFWYDGLHARLEFNDDTDSFTLDGWHFCWPNVGESCLVEEEAEYLRRRGYGGW